MINVNRIERMIEAGAFVPLLEEVIENGRPLPVSVRMRLGRAEEAAVAATALGLQRAVELTYRSTPAVMNLARRLVELMRGDEGEHGAEHPGSAAATAAAVRGFLMVREQPGFGEAGARIREAVDAALGEGLWRLAERQDEGGLIGDEIDSAVCLWQLGDRPEFREVVHVEELRAAVPEDLAAAVVGGSAGSYTRAA